MATTGYPLAFTLLMSTASVSHDFDLYLYGPTGTVLASSTGTNRQETIGYQPTSVGTCRLGARSHTGTGTYDTDLSYGGTAPALTTDR